jgi:hypothetical protein
LRVKKALGRDVLCLIKTNLINFCYVLHSSAAAVCFLAEIAGVWEHLQSRFSGKKDILFSFNVIPNYVKTSKLNLLDHELHSHFPVVLRAVRLWVERRIQLLVAQRIYLSVCQRPT